jgi:hypothetical protein
MTTAEVAKSLEIGVLQNSLNASIVLGMLACGLAMAQRYHRAVEKHLSLRVSIELWRVFTVVAVDMALVIAVLIGYLMLNPDIMADIKMAVPFCPAATVLLAVALVLRLFHGGHEVGSVNYWRSLYLMLAANISNVIGFTFIMEAPGGEYLGHNPSDASFWIYLRTHFRSNADPLGIDLSQATFYVCFPLLMLVVLWAVWSAIRQARQPEEP